MLKTLPLLPPTNGPHPKMTRSSFSHQAYGAESCASCWPHYAAAVFCCSTGAAEVCPSGRAVQRAQLLPAQVGVPCIHMRSEAVHATCISACSLTGPSPPACAVSGPCTHMCKLCCAHGCLRFPQKHAHNLQRSPNMPTNWRLDRMEDVQEVVRTCVCARKCVRMPFEDHTLYIQRCCPS